MNKGMKQIDNLPVLFDRAFKKNQYVIVSHFLKHYDYYLNNGISDIDIDILCRTRRIKNKIVRLLGCTKVYKYSFSTAYKFNYKGKKTSLDLFVINDGFYPKKWCKNMLKNSIDKEGLCFLNADNTKYSCLYHQFFHKREVNSEALDKIKFYFGYNSADILLYKNKLLSFMRDNKYRFTITLDNRRFNNVADKDIGEMISYPLSIRTKHLFIKILGCFISFLRKVKSRVLSERKENG